MGSQNPLVQRDFRTLKHCAYRNGVLLTASIAEIEASTSAFDLGAFVSGTTMRAYRTIRPKQGFEVLAGFIGIVIDGV